MPPKQMNTRMIKEALRYKFELGHSLERTAMALKISKGVVAKYVGLAKAAGLDWSQVEGMTEAQLQARLLPGRLVDGGNGHYVQPDYAAIQASGTAVECRSTNGSQLFGARCFYQPDCLSYGYIAPPDLCHTGSPAPPLRSRNQ